MLKETRKQRVILFCSQEPNNGPHREERVLMTDCLTDVVERAAKTMLVEVAWRRLIGTPNMSRLKVLEEIKKTFEVNKYYVASAEVFGWTFTVSTVLRPVYDDIQKHYKVEVPRDYREIFYVEADRPSDAMSKLKDRLENFEPDNTEIGSISNEDFWDVEEVEDEFDI